jgi:carbonic anhydrase
MVMIMRNIAALLFFLTGASFANADEISAHWSYDGKDGPSHWSEISKDYAACKLGDAQSPIDILPSEAIKAILPPLEINWKAFEPEIVSSGFEPKIVDNGHTVQVNAENAGGIILNGTSYELLQFHFHHRSEHTISGEHFPMETHFVHKSKNGNLLVVGVLLKEGAENSAKKLIIQNMPPKLGKIKLEKALNPSDLLPKNKEKFIRYAGSLTTPPCSETVLWHVFLEPVSISQAQIDAFVMLYPNNFRPAQALNRRFVLSSGLN